MFKSITQADVYQALKLVQHPEMQNHNLVELGMIPEVLIENSRILVSLALPSLEAPIKNDLINSVQQKVQEIADGLEVEVKVSEMDENQRVKFAAFAKEALSIPDPVGHIEHVLAVMSGKGGVGKSSVAGLLASALNRKGFYVGILDADITGPSIPKMFGSHQPPMTGPEGILPVESQARIKLMSINLLLPDEDQPVVWRGPLIGRAIQQFWSDIAWGQLDFLIVDLPPGTADAALTVMQSLPLDGVVLVTSPQDLAGMVVRKAANMAKKLGIPLVGLVENMSYTICPKCGARINLFGTSQADATAQQVGIPLLGRIPLDTELSILCDGGSIENYRSDSFDGIVDQVIGFVSTES